MPVEPLFTSSFEPPCLESPPVTELPPLDLTPSPAPELPEPTFPEVPVVLLLAPVFPDPASVSTVRVFPALLVFTAASPSTYDLLSELTLLADETIPLDALVPDDAEADTSVRSPEDFSAAISRPLDD